MALFGPRRIGVALGSGSARGLAHIGVLRAFEDAGLAPDVVTGTSMGALVGAMYAAGMTPDELAEVALAFDVRTITGVGDMALGRGAVFSGEKVQAFLRTYLPETFEELRLPFGCVAHDVTANRPVRFTSGNLIAAVRASVSVPMAFLPVRMGESVLVDGYVSEPVPVRLARHLGGGVVVAVEVCGSGVIGASTEMPAGGARVMRDLRALLAGDPSRQRGETGVDIVGAVSEAMEARIAAPALREADVVVSPDVHHLSGLAFSEAAAAIEAGQRAGLAATETLRRKARRR